MLVSWCHDDEVPTLNCHRRIKIALTSIQNWHLGLNLVKGLVGLILFTFNSLWWIGLLLDIKQVKRKCALKKHLTWMEIRLPF